MKTTSNQPSDFFWSDSFKQSIGALSAAVALIGLVGFVSSLAANQITFWIWGLNFFDIAVPSDIIMSGGNIFARVLGVLTLLVLYSLIYAFLLEGFSKFASTFGPRAKFIKHTPPFFVIIPIILISIYNYFPLFGCSSYICFQGRQYDGWLLIYATSLVVLSVVYGHLIAVRHAGPTFSKVREGLISPIGLFGVLTILTSSMVIVLSLNAKPRWQVVSTTAVCPSTPYVIWLGVESVIVRCEGEGKVVSSDDQLIVLRRADLVLRQIERKAER